MFPKSFNERFTKASLFAFDRAIGCSEGGGGEGGRGGDRGGESKAAGGGGGGGGGRKKERKEERKVFEFSIKRNSKKAKELSIYSSVSLCSV